MPGTGVYPEGIASAGDGTFYVGSVAQGTIFRVSLEDNTLSTPFATEELLGVVGLTVRGDRLWVCHSNPAGVEVAQIVGFDLDTGDELVRHDFPTEDDDLERGSGFCNDLTFDADGNLYATDSFGDSATNASGERASRIVRVAAEDLMTENSAEIWLAADEFVVSDAQFGLNGISADGNARLFVVRSFDAQVFEVPIAPDGSAEDPVAVQIPETLVSGDGLELVDDDTLLLIQNSTLTRVDLANGNAVTRLSAPALQTEFLTTVAVYAGAAWVVEGQLDHLLGLDTSPPMLPFRVLRIPLDGLGAGGAAGAAGG